MRRLSWIVGGAVTLVLAVFAAMNRGPVVFDLWPLPAVVEAPAFLVAMAALAVGFLAGSVMAWLQSSTARRAARQGARQIRMLEADIEALKRRVAELQAAGPKRDGNDGRTLSRTTIPGPAALGGLAEDVRRATLPTAVLPNAGMPAATAPRAGVH